MFVRKTSKITQPMTHNAGEKNFFQEMESYRHIHIGIVIVTVVMFVLYLVNAAHALKNLLSLFF